MQDTTISLYLPNKYRVVTGNHTSVALCTCWNDPFILADKWSEIPHLFSITGSLYSREGASIVLRNLALNPYIRTVLFWGAGKLSQSAIGLRGKQILFSLWENRKTQISSALDEIHKEIDPRVLWHMLENITFIDLSDKPFDQVLKIAQTKQIETTPYMKSISFPEPIKPDGAPFPSERVNFSVRGKNLATAWVRAVDRVMRYGYEKETQAGSREKELIALSWTIESPDISHLKELDWPEQLKKRVGIDESILAQYASIFLDGSKSPDVSYTYGNRLRGYRSQLDQIDRMIAKLQKDPITRRAYATTYDPIEDDTNTSPPCLISIQALVDHEQKLHLIAYFRSHDILKAALPNAYGILHVFSHIAEKTGLSQGTLTIHSTSAHIYEDDWEDAENLLKCAYWERIKLYFDENEDIDPRGVIQIAVKGKNISCTLMDDAGTELHAYLGASAREISLHFTRLGLLSRSEHTVDLAIELTKAELALKLGKEYIQDRPLIIDNVVIK